MSAEQKNKAEFLDAIVIGSGPAGMSASIYLARKGLDTLVIGDVVGGQTALSGEVDNYLGFHLMKGSELGDHFHKHTEAFSNLKHLHNLKVSSVEVVDKAFEVKTSEGESYQTQALIVASGKEPRELGVPGEKKYKNMGVTYCATCDAPLFQGKTVAVVGGGNSALDAAIQLLNYSPKIYLVNIGNELAGDAVMLDKLTGNDKVEILNNTETLKVLGEQLVNGLQVTNNEQKRTLDVQGVFVEIGSIPTVDFLPSNVILNKHNEIIIDKRNMTNVPGIFAAGDVTNVLEKQTVVAAGEGAKAAIQVAEYLNKKEA